MKRPRRQTLRGSVTQNAPVRLRAKPASRFGMLYRLGIAGGVVAVLVIGLAWSWHLGIPQRHWQRLTDWTLDLTGAAHFAIRDVIVEGRRQTSRDALSDALDAGAGTPILRFNPEEAAERVRRLPWIASVVIERRLPDTIFVRLIERVPLARWQHDTRLSVIDAEGVELTDAKPEQFADLPLVVGAEAPAASAELLSDLQGFPTIRDRISAAVRVGGRRWDLHLHAPNSTAEVVAKLPENDILGGLHRLQQLVDQQKILERDIAAIDLRLADRLIIESATPTPALKAGKTKL